MVKWTAIQRILNMFCTELVIYAKIGRIIEIWKENGQKMRREAILGRK